MVTLERVDDVFRALNRIKASEDPRNQLVMWLNRLSGDEKVRVLRTLGWHTAEYYRNHNFSAGGQDPAFEELYSEHL